MAVDRAGLESVPEDGGGEDEPHDSDAARVSREVEGDSEPLSGRLLRASRELDVAAGRHALRMLYEARDPRSEKPVWYTLALLILFVGACMSILFPLIGAILSTLAISTMDAIGASQLVQAVANSVRQTLQAGSLPLGLPPDLLWKLWSLSGIVLFVAALFGARGGKIGWIIFGGATLLLAVLGVPSQARAAMGSIVAIGWGILAIAIFRSTRRARRVAKLDRASLPKRGRRPPSRELAEVQAKRLGFQGLLDYFDNCGNRSIEDIRNDLGIRESEARNLRRELIGVERGGGMSPADKRAAIEEASSEGADITEIAKRYGTTSKTLRTLMN